MTFDWLLDRLENDPSAATRALKAAAPWANLNDAFGAHPGSAPHWAVASYIKDHCGIRAACKALEGDF